MNAPLRVLIIGSGVAGVEAALALRALGDERVAVELVSDSLPSGAAPRAPLSPFAEQVPGPVGVGQLRDAGVDVRHGRVVLVRPDHRQVVLAAGEIHHYDRLIVATGAVAVQPIWKAALLADAPVASRVVVVPLACAWALPAYEFALLRARNGDAITVVTHEVRPLELFGALASDAVGRLLYRAGVGFRGGVHALADALATDAGEPVPAAEAAVLGVPRGRPPAGLPHDHDGFLPVDEHGRVDGVEHILAAGDATAFPIKDAGLAAQQADAAAAAVAADAGLAERPEPARRVLRGTLLTGDEPLYLRTELAPGSAPLPRPHGRVARRPLWSPPDRVVGRHLTPFVHGGHARLVDLAPAPRGEPRLATPA